MVFETHFEFELRLRYFFSVKKKKTPKSDTNVSTKIFGMSKLGGFFFFTEKKPFFFFTCFHHNYNCLKHVLLFHKCVDF